MRSPPADLRLHYLQRPAPVAAWKTYFPSLELLFPSVAEQSSGSPCLAATELVVKLADDRLTAVVENLLTDEVRTIPIWIRSMHLLPPLDVVEGTYVMPHDGALPTFRTAWQRSLAKLNDPYNEAYTDAVFACMASRLVETGKSPHFCRFFGTFNGRTPTYTYSVTDDLPEIENEEWFREGLRDGKFRVVVSDPYDPDVNAEFTNVWTGEERRALCLRGTDGASTTVDSDEESDETQSSATSASDDTMSTEAESIASIKEDDGADIAATGEVVLTRPRLRLHRVEGSEGEDDDEGTDTTDSSDDGLEYKMILSDFPVQMTVIERCDGTMDDLMEEEIAETATADMHETKEARWTAWVFQVIAALTTAQQYYDFVHNDLHTNNVMWCGTGQTHMYYHVVGAVGGDRYYRVPTYGRLFKIIDFGRATFRPPTATASKKGSSVWFPDAYAPEADAAGQYNCGPYHDNKRPKVLPNKSFDLCRLAAAILDTLWPYPDESPAAAEPRRVLTREPGRAQAETVSPLWNLMWLWLTDREGCNLLRDADDNERYPNFDLYCAIAKDAVNAVPAQQLTLPLFDATYRCRRRDIPTDATIYKLQAIHRPVTV
jgi:hypothetical protein